MKNSRLLLLTITCASLCVNSVEIAIADSAAIEYQKLQAKKYQDLQTELIYLLGRRVEEQDPNKLTSIGNRIIVNLKQTNTSLDELSQLSQDQSLKQDLSTLKSILSFKSLSDSVQIGKMQAALGQTGGNKKFDRSTYDALKQKIEATGKKIVPRSSTVGSNPTADNSNSDRSPTATNKPTSSDSNFWGFLPYLFSLLSAIGSGLALFAVWSHNRKPQEKKPQERGEKQIEHKLSLFKSEVNLRVDRLESQASILSNKVSGLSHQSNLSPQINTEPVGLSSSSGSLTPAISENKDRQTAYPNPGNAMRATGRYPAPPQQSSLVDEYNRDPNAFKNKYSVQEVGEEQYNIEGRRSGQINTIQLSPTERRRGGYWVLSQDRQQILIPSADLKVNEFNRDTTEAIFDCINFNPNYRKIILIQPAIVEIKSGSYQLINRGRIEFE
jgi:hypothetical protein